MTDVHMQRKYDEHMRLHGNKRVTWQQMLAVLEGALAAAAKRILALEQEIAALRSASSTDDEPEVEPTLLKPNLEATLWN